MRGVGKIVPARRRHIAVVLALAAMTVSGCSRAEQPATVSSEALVGTWTLVSVEQRTPSGETIQWMGPKPLGLLIYDRAGNVSVQIMRDPSLPQMPADLQGGYYAYFGQYEVKGREGTVVHRIQGSMRPSEVGAAYTRSVRLSGDRLVLSLTPTRTLTWQRSK